MAHPEFVTVAKEAVAGRYAKLGWWANFASEWTDADGRTHKWVLPNGSVNWARDNGHLNRHFHWVAMAAAWRKTGEATFAKRFAFEVNDWVKNEPFYWERCPQVGGINLMDGTIFRLGYMNTSNIGRRCELTWWHAYDTFRATEDFDDEAHLAMLVGFLRQARLLMNPTSFAAHDDGGAHGAMALLQTALMMKEFKESGTWKAEALRRWDEVLRVQFYPDGSHVSGSTGYNWASLKAIENFIALMKRVGEPVPERFRKALADALRHPIGLSRPDQGQIDLNDGGWGLVDDHYQRVLTNIFPERADFRWMASRGTNGTPPDYKSIYFPHAGHFVTRTGWGKRERYLFMDAGPMGASHGKNDKLSIYLALGPHQLISSGGRGSYDANPFSGYANSTYGYNTLIVDDLPQQRVHLKHTHTGHVPESRRWITNDHFDYAEGFYRSGWYGEKRMVRGTHTRQVLFLKGANPPESACWVVIDSVLPEDDESHDYKALFHSRRDAMEIDPATRVVTSLDRAAGFRIIPAMTDGLAVRDAKGQTQPYIQGWHVVGRRRAAMHTAEFSWSAKGPTLQAWVIDASLAPANWSVRDVRVIRASESEVRLTIEHRDGTRHHLARRAAHEKSPWKPFGASKFMGDVAVLFEEHEEPSIRLDVRAQANGE